MKHDYELEKIIEIEREFRKKYISNSVFNKYCLGIGVSTVRMFDKTVSKKEYNDPCIFIILQKPLDMELPKMYEGVKVYTKLFE